MASATKGVQTRNANAFFLANESGETKITYYPEAPGPLIQGLSPGALFDYAGPEGTLRFRSAQISRQETPSGQLLSVVLKPQFDTGSITFSLFLPPVKVDLSGSQTFRTYGVKTHHAGFVAKPGAAITYEMELFDGEAKAQPMPR